MGGIIFGLIVAALIGAMIWILKNMLGNRSKNIQALKNEYEKAIQSGNKKVALEAGRKYYSTLRGGLLTVYDEQAITNDLNAMQ